MNQRSFAKPYSTLPEPYALLALVVWVGLVAIMWPDMASPTNLAWRALLFGVLLSGAASHSWFVARTGLWSREPAAIAVTISWLLVVGVASAFVGGGMKNSLVGLLAFLQIALCSLIFSHVALRVTLLTAFVVMLSSTSRLPLFVAGAAWLLFAVLAMFLLAYDRTAVKAGPGGYGRREQRHTGLRVRYVSIVALAAAALFLITPLLASIDLDLGSGLRSGKGSGRTAAESKGMGYGLSESTSASAVAFSDVPIMRLHTAPRVAGPLYVRGRIFDTFDGETWTNSSAGDTVEPLSNGFAQLPKTLVSGVPDRSPNLSQTYEMLVRFDDGVVFSVGRPLSVQFWEKGPTLLSSTKNGAMWVNAVLQKNARYTVEGAQDIFSDGQLNRVRAVNADDRKLVGVTPRDTQTPRGISAEVKRRAYQVTAGASSSYESALAIESYLRTNYTYSLDHDVSGADVVGDFLLGGRGHCALFASSMIMMLRSLGVPARYVTGFLARDPDPKGFLVRGTDGHAWVEVYVEGLGWVAFDPTAPAAPGAGLARGSQSSGPGVRPEMRSGDADRMGNVAGLYGRKDYGKPVGSPDRRTRGDGRGGATEGLGGMFGRDSETGGPGDDAGGGSAVDDPPGADAPRQPDSASGRSGAAGVRTGAPDGDDETAQQAGTFRSPGGDTSLPRADQRPAPQAENSPSRANAGATGRGQGAEGGTAPGGADPGKNSEKGAAAAPEPAQVGSAWRWLVALLVIIGVTGLGMLLAWDRGVEPVLERQRVQNILRPGLEDERDPRRFIVKLYHTMTGGLGRLGISRKVGDTPTEYARTVARREPRLERPVDEITELFHAARYGNEPVTAEHADRARSAWKHVASVARRADLEEPAEGNG